MILRAPLSLPSSFPPTPGRGGSHQYGPQCGLPFGRGGGWYPCQQICRVSDFSGRHQRDRLGVQGHLSGCSRACVFQWVVRQDEYGDDGRRRGRRDRQDTKRERGKEDESSSHCQYQRWAFVIPIPGIGEGSIKEHLMHKKFFL